MIPDWLRQLHYFPLHEAGYWVSPRHLIAFLELAYPHITAELRETGGVPFGMQPVDDPSRLDGYISIVHNSHIDHANETNEASNGGREYALTRSMRQRFFLPRWIVSRPLIVPLGRMKTRGEPSAVNDLCTFPNFWLFLELYFSESGPMVERAADQHRSFLEFYRSCQLAYAIPSDSRFAYDNMVYLCRAASEDEFYDPFIAQALVLNEPPYPAEYQDPGVYERHRLIRGIFKMVERREREKRNME